jgi:hypothetical protein
MKGFARQALDPVTIGDYLLPAGVSQCKSDDDTTADRTRLSSQRIPQPSIEILAFILKATNLFLRDGSPAMQAKRPLRGIGILFQQDHECALESSKCRCRYFSESHVINCLSFALKEVRLILAVLLRRFDLSIVPDQKIEYRHHSVLYIASGEYLVSVRKRVA